MRPNFSLNDHNSPPPMAKAEAMPPATHAAWRSPVPYLFGGIAAMLSLITFALLVLACSYWKLSGYMERVEGNEHASETANSGDRCERTDEAQEKDVMNMQQQFVVVMAGDEKKIFLAKPIRCGASVVSGDGGEEESSAKIEDESVVKENDR